MALRFAPIIRVRPEKQKKKGESLRTQETQIRQYIAMLEKAIPGGACIPECCWQYKGQEHATPNRERVLLDRLLKDSSKDIFNAMPDHSPRNRMLTELRGPNGVSLPLVGFHTDERST